MEEMINKFNYYGDLIISRAKPQNSKELELSQAWREGWKAAVAILMVFNSYEDKKEAEEYLKKRIKDLEDELGV